MWGKRTSACPCWQNMHGLVSDHPIGWTGGFQYKVLQRGSQQNLASRAWKFSQIFVPTFTYHISPFPLAPPLSTSITTYQLLCLITLKKAAEWLTKRLVSLIILARMMDMTCPPSHTKVHEIINYIWHVNWKLINGGSQLRVVRPSCWLLQSLWNTSKLQIVKNWLEERLYSTVDSGC